MKWMQAAIASMLISLATLAWAGPVNVNTADAGTLAKELNGVGPKTAQAIIDEREKGKFKDAADLEKRVKGIGSKTISKNKENLQF